MMTMGCNPSPVLQSDLDSAVVSHCRRVSALVMEVCHADSFGPSGALRQVEAVARAVRFCSVVDERLEELQFGYRDIDEVLDAIEQTAPDEAFDPDLLERFRQMRCRDLPPQITRGDGLPVEALAAREVFHRLGQDREYEVRELAATAVRDPVLSASLLRVANSSLYSPNSKVSAVSQAIAYIGTVEARKVMLADALRPLFASAGLVRLWTHSVAAAQFGASLAAQTSIIGPEDGQILGLIHDFGRLA